MGFPFNVYLVAVVSAFCTTAASLPLWRKWCLRADLIDDPGHRKIHDRPIVLAGGLAVATGLILPVVLGAVLLYAIPTLQGGSAAHALHYGLGRRAIELAGILLGAVGMLIVGLFDDRMELRPAIKFGGQLLIAALVAACGVRITLFVPSLVFSYAITILWLLTIINALNFMDNMNGLCAGLGAIGAWHFAIIAAADGQYLVALIAFLTFGALAGFLPYNFPNARSFLGDGGSHLVGYLR